MRNVLAFRINGRKPREIDLLVFLINIRYIMKLQNHIVPVYRFQQNWFARCLVYNIADFGIPYQIQRFVKISVAIYYLASFSFKNFSENTVWNEY